MYFQIVRLNEYGPLTIILAYFHVAVVKQEKVVNKIQIIFLVNSTIILSYNMPLTFAVIEQIRKIMQRVYKYECQCTFMKKQRLTNCLCICIFSTFFCTLLVSSWWYRDVVHCDFQSDQTAYKEGLRKVIRKKRQDLWKDKLWFWHHYNTPSHTPLIRSFRSRLFHLTCCCFKRPFRDHRFETIE